MASDPQHTQRLERLRAHVLKRWWQVTLWLWLTVGLLSLWSLRHEFAILRQYFTWTAVRYALAYHRLAAVGLGLCVGLTVALLISESRQILFGLSQGERRRLEMLLHRIRQQGDRHPLWKQLYGDSTELRD